MNFHMIIGLTGGIASGKTTVAGLFKKKGALVLDADKIARKVIERDSPVYRKVVRFFGSDILNKDRSINRRCLAKIVFSSSLKLKKLNSFIHPVVIKIINDELKKRKGKRVVVIDAPLLIEANLSSLVDRLIVVKTKQKIQINRIVAKMKLSRSEILKRIKNQISLRDKIKLADYVIDNGSSFKNTEKQVKDIWNKKIRSNEVQTYGTA